MRNLKPKPKIYRLKQNPVNITKELLATDKKLKSESESSELNKSGYIFIQQFVEALNIQVSDEYANAYYNDMLRDSKWEKIPPLSQDQIESGNNKIIASMDKNEHDTLLTKPVNSKYSNQKSDDYYTQTGQLEEKDLSFHHLLCDYYIIDPCHCVETTQFQRDAKEVQIGLSSENHRQRKKDYFGPNVEHLLAFQYLPEQKLPKDPYHMTLQQPVDKKKVSDKIELVNTDGGGADIDRNRSINQYNLLDLSDGDNKKLVDLHSPKLSWEEDDPKAWQKDFAIRKHGAADSDVHAIVAKVRLDFKFPIILSVITSAEPDGADGSQLQQLMLRPLLSGDDGQNSSYTVPNEELNVRLRDKSGKILIEKEEFFEYLDVALVPGFRQIAGL